MSNSAVFLIIVFCVFLLMVAAAMLIAADNKWKKENRYLKKKILHLETVLKAITKKYYDLLDKVDCNGKTKEKKKEDR
jgi:uncharacterized protein YlxW (UPF0749 family)